jgi:hypothetical protein
MKSDTVVVQLGHEGDLWILSWKPALPELQENGVQGVLPWGLVNAVPLPGFILLRLGIGASRSVPPQWPAGTGWRSCPRKSSGRPGPGAPASRT